MVANEVSECRQLFLNTSQEFTIPCNRNVFSIYGKCKQDILDEVFPLNPESSFSLRNQQTFTTRPIHTVHYGSNSLSYLGPKIWEMIPSDVKNLRTVKDFKFVIKRWLP